MSSQEAESSIFITLCPTMAGTMDARAKLADGNDFDFRKFNALNDKNILIKTYPYKGYSKF